MSPVQKQALKDLLHLIVDKEEIAVLQDLASHLPVGYASVASSIIGGVGPAAVAAEDAAIDKALPAS